MTEDRNGNSADGRRGDAEQDHGVSENGGAGENGGPDHPDPSGEASTAGEPGGPDYGAPGGSDTSDGDTPKSDTAKSGTTGGGGSHNGSTTASSTGRDGDGSANGRRAPGGSNDAGAGSSAVEESTDPAAADGAEPADGRPYDIVLFGATGFTGELTAEYLARNAPEGLRWALAGRNRRKLESLRKRLTEVDPRCALLPLLTADVADRRAVRQLAAQTRVVATTVGPYIRYGSALVAACAEEGTDYVDLAGEPEFVDLMYLRHHARARETGARLVHSCGFDSVPYDLGARFTVERLPQGVPLFVDGYVRSNATLSGGTLSSALLAFSRMSRMARTAKERRRAEPRPRDRRVRTPTGRVRRSRDMGGWAVPLPTIDPQIVGRSAAALERYGPDFSYRHCAAVRRLPVVLGGAVGMGALFVLAQLPFTRRAVQSRLAPGEGPSKARRDRSWFTATFVGRGGTRRVVTQVSGGDPGYDETAKILAESAMCLAWDSELPDTSGQVTTAVAMGEALTGRLVRAGIGFRVLEETVD